MACFRPPTLTHFGHSPDLRHSTGPSRLGNGYVRLDWPIPCGVYLAMYLTRTDMAVGCAGQCVDPLRPLQRDPVARQGAQPIAALASPPLPHLLLSFFAITPDLGMHFSLHEYADVFGRGSSINGGRCNVEERF